jgi:signal transduction histidine kinase
MDCYKLELGKLKFSKANIGVPDLINNSLLEIKPFTADKQIEIKSNVKMTGTVYCDPKRIEQVLSNLLKNSIDFVPQDDGKLTVSAEKGQDSQAVLAICKGIVEAHDGKIWVDKTRIKGAAIKFSLPITGK